MAARKTKFQPLPILTAAAGGAAGAMAMDALDGIPAIAAKTEYSPALLLVAATGLNYFVNNAIVEDLTKGAAGVAGAQLAAGLLNAGATNGYRVQQGIRTGSSALNRAV